MDSDDEYIVQQFSDEGGIDSSDDDELVMKEFLDQSKSGRKRSLNDFEAEMKEELERRVTSHLVKEDISDPTTSMNDGFKEKKPRDKYFDTDSEEEIDEEDPTIQAQSNIDLFYDPLMDTKDEAFVEKQRNKYRKKFRNQTNQKPLANSDAVLNCPACFTTLCHDCQRHETYKTQYRAMFTFHCQVDTSEVMKIPLQSQKSRSKKSLGSADTPANFKSSDAEETYHPVRCATCNTHVAMFDHDEVYHFFNVVTSH